MKKQTNKGKKIKLPAIMRESDRGKEKKRIKKIKSLFYVNRKEPQK